MAYIVIRITAQRLMGLMRIMIPVLRKGVLHAQTILDLGRGSKKP